MTRRLAPDQTSAEIACQLNAAGLRTGKGTPFAADSVGRWILWRHQFLPDPEPGHNDGELTVCQEYAETLGVSIGTVYDWISTGKLTARRGPAMRLFIPFPPEVEQQCRERVQNWFTYPPKPKSGLQEVQYEATVPTIRRQYFAQTTVAMGSWSRWWSRGSTRTPMAIGRDARPT